MELLLIYGQQVKLALLMNKTLVYYEESNRNATSLDVIYQKLKNMELDEITILTQGYLSNEQFPDGHAAFSFLVGKERYYCNVKKQELEELESFASCWGIQAKIFDRFGYYRNLTNENVLCVDEFEYACAIIWLKNASVQKIQYVAKENLRETLEQYQSKSSLLLESSHTYKCSWLEKYENLDSIHTESFYCVKTALSMLEFTKNPVAQSYQIDLNATCITMIDDEPKEKVKNQRKPVQIISRIVTVAILLLTLLTGITFTTNQYISKDIVAIETRNVGLDIQLAHEKEELKQKEQYSKSLSNQKNGNITYKLYQMKLNGYLGKIAFEEHQMKVLLYLNRKRDLPRTKKQMDEIAKVLQIKKLQSVKIGQDKMLQKYEFILKHGISAKEK